MTAFDLRPHDRSDFVGRRLCGPTERAYFASESFLAAFDFDVHAKREELGSGEETHLYFICEADIGVPFKIGLSQNPFGRLASLQGATHRDLYLFAAVPANAPLEKYLHHVCRRDRLRGEWFQPGRRVLALAEVFRSVEQMLWDFRNSDLVPSSVDTIALLSSRTEDAAWWKWYARQQAAA